MNQSKYIIKFKNQTITQEYDKESLIDFLKNYTFEEIDKYKDGHDAKWRSIESIEFFDKIEFRNKFSFITQNNNIKYQSNSNEDFINNSVINDAVDKNVNSILENTEKEINKINEEQNNIEDAFSELVEENKNNHQFIGDKTIISKDTLEFLEAEKRKKEEEEREKFIEEQLKKQDLSQSEDNIESDTTQFIDLSKLKQLDNENLDEISEKYERQEKENLLERKRLEALNEAIDKDNDEEDDEDEEELVQNKKKRIVFALIIMGLLFILLSPEEKKNTERKFEPAKIEILFPIPFAVADKEKSNKLALLAYENYKEYTFSKLVTASKLYRSAVENDYSNNEYIGKLLLCYGELLSFLRDNKTDAQLVFKLLQIKESEMFSNVDFMTAKALFFMSQKKYATTVREIAKFLELGNKPNLRLFSLFLTSLYQTGKFEKAESVYQTIIKQKNIFNPRVYEELIKYKIALSENEAVINLINESIKILPNSVPILLLRSKILLSLENYKDLVITLNDIKKSLYEGSKYYYSLFLIYHGKLSLIRKQNNEAKKYFEQALKLDSSLDIRSLIANIDENKIPEAKSIIQESKAITLITKSKQEMKVGDWRKAVLYAVDAVDIAPDFLEAVIHLAEIQIIQGNFKRALKRLQDIHAKYPQNAKVNFSLLKAYIDAFQFSKARNLLSSIGNSDLRNNYMFSSLQGYMYSGMGSHLESIKWYQNSININPVNDEDFYAISQEYFKIAKKKSVKDDIFEKSKLFISKAIELAPDNAKYRVAYSKVIYEQSGADAAIGYLRELDRDFPFNALVMSEIAINYFKIGNIKKFEELKEKIKQLPDKKSDFYKFLIDAAMLDEKYNDVIKYGLELLNVNPGDLQTRMLIGEIFLSRAEKDDLRNASEIFKEVKDKLDSYPKVNLNQGKIALMIDNVEIAKKYFEDEIKHNPDIIDSYIELANVYIKEKDYTSAEKYFERAQQRDPNSVKALMGMAALNIDKNQLEVALELLQKALNMEPSNARLHKFAGDVYRRMGQSALAIKSYKAHLEFESDSKYKAEIETYIRNFD